MDILFGIFLFFVIIILAARIFIRYGLPYILGRFIRKQEQNFYQSNNQSQQQKKEEGEVKIRQKSSTNKKRHKDDKTFGEYVDFEDVEQ